MNDIVNKIYELMAQTGTSKAKLARKIGVSRNTVQNWKKRDSIPSISVIERICKAFNITAEQFFCGMGRTAEMSKDEKFINEWRILTQSEKETIEKVIATFKEDRTVIK